MGDILLKDTAASDVPAYRVYVDGIGNANINSAVFTPPGGSGLTIDSATPDNTTTPRSVVVVVSGAPLHGRVYQLSGVITLSTSQVISRSVTVRTHKI